MVRRNVNQEIQEEIKNPNDGKIRYKKLGGGSFRLHGKIIKPGQVFLARPNEIPKAFKDVLVPQEPLPENISVEEQIVKASLPEYSLQERNRKGWFDIVNKDGKKLNEKALKEEEANQLLKDLSK